MRFGLPGQAVDGMLNKYEIYIQDYGPGTTGNIYKINIYRAKTKKLLFSYRSRFAPPSSGKRTRSITRMVYRIIGLRIKRRILNHLL